MVVTGNTPMVLLPSGKRVQGLHPSLQIPGFLPLWTQTQPKASLGDAAQSSNTGPGSAGTALGYKWRGRAGEHHRGLGNGTPVSGGGPARFNVPSHCPLLPILKALRIELSTQGGGAFYCHPRTQTTQVPVTLGPWLLWGFSSYCALEASSSRKDKTGPVPGPAAAYVPPGSHGGHQQQE